MSEGPTRPKLHLIPSTWFEIFGPHVKNLNSDFRDSIIDMPTQSQLYLSTRGGSTSFSFKAAVLKGLASDGGLFIPHQIPTLPSNALSSWTNLSFQDLALEIMSLYISAEEIPKEDLKALIQHSYSTFRTEEITPLVELVGSEKLYLLELFHGPTYAFKDVALQFLGNLFEYFLIRENEGKEGKERDHLTVLGATSGDTGSAAIYGLRGKKDVDVFILHPHKRISPIQEAQMTTVLDKNVHNLAVNGTFDDCQVCFQCELRLTVRILSKRFLEMTSLIKSSIWEL